MAYKFPLTFALDSEKDAERIKYIQRKRKNLERRGDKVGAMREIIDLAMGADKNK